MARPLFVDAHAHLWDLTHAGYDWLRAPFRDDVAGGSKQAIARSYGLDDYLAETAGWNVAGMVHVEAGTGASEDDGGNRLASGNCRYAGDADRAVAFAALDAPDLDRALAFHAGHPRVRGVRHLVDWHADPAMTCTARDVTTDPAWRAGYAGSPPMACRSTCIAPRRNWPG